MAGGAFGTLGAGFGVTAGAFGVLGAGFGVTAGAFAVLGAGFGVGVGVAGADVAGEADGSGLAGALARLASPFALDTVPTTRPASVRAAIFGRETASAAG